MTEREPGRSRLDLAELAALLQTDCGIAKKHQIDPAKVERMLELQLENLQHLDHRTMHTHPLDQSHAERIVTAGGIADAKNEYRARLAQSRTRRSSVAPSADSSSSTSGIWPSAWVAHDRHGSNARIATSMWLSKPSVSLRPLR